MKKITIIIPIYNAEIYIDAIIQNVLNQSYTNFELILINDGSTDSSQQICETYKAKDNRIVLLSQVNKGPAAARNIGIKLAKGDFIGFVDADDYIESNMFEKLVSIAIKEKTDVVISHFKNFNKGSTRYTVPKTKIPTNMLLGKNKIKECILKSYYGSLDILIPALWNKIYKKEFLAKNNFFIDECRVRAEDYWFNFDVFKKAESVYVIEGAYYHYYENDNSIMKTFRENQFDFFLETQKKLKTENLKLGFKINSQEFYKPFIENTNEYILMAISQKGYLGAYKFVKKIIRNKEFNQAFKKVVIVKWHIIFIKYFLKIKVWIFSYLIYCIWSTKIKNSRN